MLKIVASLILSMLIAVFYVGCDISNYDDQSRDYMDNYQIVIEKYHEAEISNFESYDENYVDGSDLFRLTDDKAYYALYDIDKNGIPELFIGSVNSRNYESIVNIWSLKDNKPLRLFEKGFGARYRGWMLNNGYILAEGSGSAFDHVYNFYKMSSNGNYVELENGFTTAYPRAEGETLIITQTDSAGVREITEPEFERTMNSYTGITAFPFDRENLDTVEFDWKPVSETVF